MIRKTLTIFSLIGLLLSLGLWGASYWRCTYVGLSRGVELRNGWFRCGKVTEVWIAADAPDRQQMLRSALGGGSHQIAIGRRSFAWRDFRSLQTYWWDDSLPAPITFPLWMPASLFVILPCYRLLPFHRRRKRKKLGLCVKCGYDLRASKDRCPECGAGFTD